MTKRIPTGSLRHVDQNIETAYSHFYSLSLQHELFSNTVVSVLLQELEWYNGVVIFGNAADSSSLWGYEQRVDIAGSGFNRRQPARYIGQRILAAIGMKGRRIMSAFLTEAGLLATGGVLAGLIMGIVISLVVARIGLVIRLETW